MAGKAKPSNASWAARALQAAMTHTVQASARRVRRATWPIRKLHRTGPLWAEVLALLALKLSPEQIAATLRQRHPGQSQLQASHETIYTAIYAMPKGELRRELSLQLCQARAARRPAKRGLGKRGALQDMLPIHVRPPEANDRLLPGHCEGDLIKGKANASAVGTLVCRKSLFVMLVKLDGSTAADALKGFSRVFRALPPQMRQTMTYDQGKEMALHKKLAERTGLKVYFCDPHSPWQRGINENTNGLLRQYLPKGTDLSVHTQEDLDAMAWELNIRPCKTMGWQSAAEVFFNNEDLRVAGLIPTVALGV